ncbi:hypothetical protein GCM10007390_43980 [Persicitalea jodogahamensis]|uniref:Transposase IS200-like domain-containing protein n=2 Tax=Persicitalea jodogahamensis TaxID=402147 RepID=A0A8J3GBT1_9BACT|nr:hypothetical protein GCM10007390_43980 [Persicitalea jodogahamensis]
MTYKKKLESEPMKNNEIPLLPGNFYHVFNHANGNEDLFLSRENYSFFLKRYGFYINPIADTFAYCLMPNHFHVLVRIKDSAALIDAYHRILTSRDTPKEPKEFSQSVQTEFVSRQFASLFSSYSQAFNKQQGRKGSLFIPNFKRKHVASEKYYMELIHYIHANPIHHGFTRDMTAWEFSSYHAFVSQKTTMLHREEALCWFNGVDGFEKYHRDTPDGYRSTLDFG